MGNSDKRSSGEIRDPGHAPGGVVTGRVPRRGQFSSFRRVRGLSSIARSRRSDLDCAPPRKPTLVVSDTRAHRLGIAGYAVRTQGQRPEVQRQQRGGAGGCLAPEQEAHAGQVHPAR